MVGGLGYVGKGRFNGAKLSTATLLADRLRGVICSTYASAPRPSHSPTTPRLWVGTIGIAAASVNLALISSSLHVFGAGPSSKWRREPVLGLDAWDLLRASLERKSPKSEGKSRIWGFRACAILKETCVAISPRTGGNSQNRGELSRISLLFISSPFCRWRKVSSRLSAFANIGLHL